MPFAQIANSVMTNQAGPGTSFTTSASKFAVVCTAGELSIQVQAPNGWVNLAELMDNKAETVRVFPGQMIVVENIGTGINYRLVGINGRATGSASDLS